MCDASFCPCHFKAGGSSGIPARCFPDQEFLLLLNLYQFFSSLSTRRFFSYYLNHPCCRLGLFLPT